MPALTLPVALLFVALVANIPAWLILRAYSFSGYECLQTVALIDTLLAVLWYAQCTYQLVSNDARRLLASSRPVVVIDWTYVEPSRHGAPSGWMHVAKNIGPGLALNAVVIDDREAKTLTVTPIGALGPGDLLPLSPKIRDVLWAEGRDGWHTRKRHVIVSERIDSREWSVTENLVELGGGVTHRVKFKMLPQALVDQIHAETVAEYVDRNWSKIQSELATMFPEQQPQPSSDQ